jgi:hypothetical protein
VTDGGPDADALDAAADATVPDAGDAAVEAGSPTCNYGSATSFATDQSLDIFGTPSYFDDGGALPAGQYEIAYVDGCMKYASYQGWTVNAYNGDPDSWWVVGSSTSQRILVPPGTVGYDPSAGAFDAFDACVAANLALTPIDFSFDGGPLGIWLQDSPYSDNLAGVDGRNPKWTLTLLGGCPDAAAP